MPRRVPRGKGPFKGLLARGYEQLRATGYSAADAHRIMATIKRADDEGYIIEWVADDGEFSEEGYPLWSVLAEDEDGKILDAMGGIDLGETGPDAHHSIAYQWDAEAQVLSEALP